jgi:hypothetical protein
MGTLKNESPWLLAHRDSGGFQAFDAALPKLGTTTPSCNTPWSQCGSNDLLAPCCVATAAQFLMP